ncbi:MAG TPA: hypothetical protein VNJ08_10695 [Bacteriovoracaceae bacterium]|nr:hypothetical protein [Bacteriovoracaceae bacterium]
MKLGKAIGFLSLMSLVACGGASKSPIFGKAGSNGPAAEEVILNVVPLMDLTHNMKFEALPLEGSVDISKRLWSGDHWPSNRGGLNRRWNAPPEEPGFNTLSPTREELTLMTPEDIARLSPSEKWDLLLGQYDYPFKKEVALYTNPVAISWEGIGNGWASASINHDEPTPRVLTNADGIVIPFGSSDIKALLSYYYAFSKKLPITQNLGLRCPVTPDGSKPDEFCTNDLNAGSFHIAIGNKLGLQKQAIVGDIDRYSEVWNQPFIAYKSQVLETLDPVEGTLKGTVKILRMKTKIYYAGLAEGNSWDPIIGTFRNVTTNRIYNYDLFINAAGEIHGGAWISGDRPDFIWVMPRVETFEDNFAALAQLLN